jgi:uncharacterized repeat protein (TIGR02543 family)
MRKTTTLSEVSPFMRQPPRTLKNFNAIILLISLFATFFFGCKKDGFEDEVIGLCPVVVSTDPMDKAVDVEVGKVISITFNTEMDSSTINSTTVLIKQGTTVVAGKLASTASSKIFTFTPNTALTPFAAYSGTVTTGAKDKFKTAMVADYLWSFTTIPTLTLTSTPASGGTLVGAGAFAEGSTVTVMATPNIGFTFTSWTDGTSIVSTSPSYQFKMAGNKALVANFTAIPAGNFALNLSSSPAAGGTTSGSGAYLIGSNVTASATANTGYTFLNWTDGATIVSTSSNYQFVLSANRTLVANFRAIPATQFAVSLTSTPTSGGTTNGEGAYASGTSVTITAAQNTGYTFVNWTDKTSNLVVSTSPSYTFVLTQNKTFVANFVLNVYSLTVVAQNGTVSKTPDQANYNHGTLVSLIATPAAGYVFTSWSGDASGSTNPLQVAMNSSKTVTANFTLITIPPTPISILGSAALFGAFGGNAGITNMGINTVINDGNIGTTAASTLITGFHDGQTAAIYTETPLNIGLVNGRIYTAPPAPGNAASMAIAALGLADATIAYNSISPAAKPGGSDPGAGELGGLTLAPGIYKSAGATFKITTGNLTLDAKGDPNAQWFFQTAAGLTVGIAGPAGARSVNVINGGQAKNVYWYVGSSAIINAAGGGVMTGTIISTAGVTFSTAGNTVQTVLNGRALSLVASVTMVNTTINVPK